MTRRIPKIDRYNHQIAVMISRIKWIASRKNDEVYSKKIIWSTKKQRNEQIWNLGNRLIPPEINAFCGELRATCRQEIKRAIKRATSSLKWWRTKPACHQHARSWLDRHDLIAVPTDKDGGFA